MKNAIVFAGKFVGYFVVCFSLIYTVMVLNVIYYVPGDVPAQTLMSGAMKAIPAALVISITIVGGRFKKNRRVSE